MGLQKIPVCYATAEANDLYVKSLIEWYSANSQQEYQELYAQYKDKATKLVRERCGNLAASQQRVADYVDGQMSQLYPDVNDTNGMGAALKKFLNIATEEHLENYLPDLDLQEPISEYGDWQPWSPCSASCGGGDRIRSRFCSIDECSDGLRLQVVDEPCNVEECQQEPSSEEEASEQPESEEPVSEEPASEEPASEEPASEEPESEEPASEEPASEEPATEEEASEEPESEEPVSE